MLFNQSYAGSVPKYLVLAILINVCMLNTSYSTSTIPYGWKPAVSIASESYDCGTCNNLCSSGCPYATGWYYHTRYEVIWGKYSHYEIFDLLSYPNCFQEWDCGVVINYGGTDWEDFLDCAIGCQGFTIEGTLKQLIELSLLKGAFQSLTAWVGCLSCFDLINTPICNYVTECKKLNPIRYYDSILGRVKLQHDHPDYSFIIIPSL